MTAKSAMMTISAQIWAAMIPSKSMVTTTANPAIMTQEMANQAMNHNSISTAIPLVMGEKLKDPPSDTP